MSASSSHAVRQLVQYLTKPELDQHDHAAMEADDAAVAARWSSILCAARALSLDATLALRLRRANTDLPRRLAQRLEDIARDHAVRRSRAMWEVDCARRALGRYDGRVVLLKGSAYAAAGLDAATGRHIGDLDILVERDGLKPVERMLLAAGWDWVKQDSYDDHYYRQWMHELPPLIHKERERMIDVHHTILPLTARRTPDAKAMLEQAVRLKQGFYVLSPADMICHSAAHMLADGELAGGLRNLWDIDQMLREFSASPEGADTERHPFWQELEQRSSLHELHDTIALALWLAHRIFATPVPAPYRKGGGIMPRLVAARIMAVNGWGQKNRAPLRRAFYLRSHLLRMPPAMLARHLWTKWRKGYRPQG